MLDTDDEVVPNFVKCRGEGRPVHIAKSGKFRNCPAETATERPVLIEQFTVDAHVFSMHVKDAVGEIVNGTDRIDKLPDEMGRIVIEPEMIVGNDLEHSLPDSRGRREIRAAWPGVFPEHRAILDGDLDATIPGVADDHRP